MSTSIFPANSRSLAFSNIPPKPLAWLWQNYIPRGKLSLLAGDPGSGKTALILDLAARLSTHDRLPPFPVDPNRNRNPNRNPVLPAVAPNPEPWTPNPEPAAPLATLLLSPEDNLADTLRPRLESLGADISLIHTLPHFHSLVESILIDGESVPPLQHLEFIIQSIPNLALLVIDPITYYIGLTDRLLPSNPSHPSPRSILHALAHLAARHDIAILLNTRLTKKCPDADPTNLRRALGSLAFASAARTVHLLLPNSDLAGGSGHTLFAPLKNNLAEAPPALSFLPATRLQWDPDPIYLPHPEKPAPHKPPADNTELAYAVKFLQAALAPGPARATSLQSQAQENLVTLITLRRAKDFLDCDSQWSPVWNAWFWSLKGDNRPILSPFQKLQNEMSISAAADPILQQLQSKRGVTKKKKKAKK